MMLLVCLSLLGYCFALTRFARWSIEYTPFFVTASVIVLLYCFAYWHFLQWGTPSILIVGLGIFALTFWRVQYTPGFIIFILSLFLLSLLASQAHLSQWDEFTHWGPHSKLVLLHHGFYTASDVTIHKSYPPGSALFYYLFFQWTGYSESVAYIAQCILTLAPISIFLTSWRRWSSALIVCVLTLIVLFFLHVQVGFKNSLYMDNVVGIYTGMALVVYLQSQQRWQQILYLLSIVMAIVLFKQKLMPFVLLISGIISCDQIRLRFSKQIDLRQFLLSIISLFSLPLASGLITYSWHRYLKTIHVPMEWQLPITLSKIKAAFSAASGTTEHHIIFYFAYKITQSFWFIAIIFLLTALTFFLQVKKTGRTQTLFMQILFLIGFCAYAFGLLLMYLFSFSGIESLELASFARYLNIYYIAWALPTLYFLYVAINQRSFHAMTVARKYLCAAILIAVPMVFLFHHVPPQSTTAQSVTHIANVIQKITPSQANIFVVWQNSTGEQKGMLDYALVPRRLNTGCISFGKPYMWGDVWTCHVNSHAFLSAVHDYQYLLLAHVDQNFWRHYQIILPDRDTLKPIATYTLCKNIGFSQLDKPGCQKHKYHAYLFKIMHNHGHILFQNVTSES